MLPREQVSEAAATARATVEAAVPVTAEVAATDTAQAGERALNATTNMP